MSTAPDLTGKRVLITGGLGFIGSNLAHRCLELGARVTAYDCLDPRSGGNLHNLHGIENAVEVVLNDIRNFEGLCACIRGQDLLFHCAAYTSHPNSMREPLIDIDVNCKGTLNVLEAARRFNPALKIVHVGSSTQIGRMVRKPIDEEHGEFPIDMYSANKTASEKYVLVYSNAYRMRGTVVRLANTFGPRSNIRTPDFGFVNYFIGLGLKGKDLPVYGDGAQMRNISYVADVVAALLAAATNDASDGQAFFAVSDQQYSVRQIADAIAEHIGGQVRSVPWPGERATIEIGDAVISNAKIARVLGWKPSHDVKTGLVQTRMFFAPNLGHYLD
jgi:UDP-glucose 4-epimerase